MPETDKSIVIAEIDGIKWQSNTGQSVLKSKGFYRTGGHFTGLVRRSDGISFSLVYWFYNNKYVSIINSEYILCIILTAEKKTYRLKIASIRKSSVAITLPNHNFSSCATISTWKLLPRSYRRKQMKTTAAPRLARENCLHVFIEENGWKRFFILFKSIIIVILLLLLLKQLFF